MKGIDVKSLTDKELQERIAQEAELLQKLKFAHAISPIENPMKIRASRRMIARLKTEVSKRAAQKTK